MLVYSLTLYTGIWNKLWRILGFVLDQSDLLHPPQVTIPGFKISCPVKPKLHQLPSSNCRNIKLKRNL